MSAIPASIGRYEVQRFIARGGMGKVYLATDPVLQRQVAIKLLQEADNDDLRIRFTREARAAANLRHRNIVTIFDIGEHDGHPFMAMEYIQGQTLKALISSDPPPSTIRRLNVVEDLCDGLSFAHSRGVIHRDIKPANLMVDADGVLKILDFGIARAAAEAGMTQAGLLVGSLNYMSPEQVAGAALDSRSDMFAVGLVLYELFAGREAFPGGVDTGVLNKILQGEPEPLETIAPHLDPAIPAIVRRALQKDPARRFNDLQEMRAEVARVRQALEAAVSLDEDPTIEMTVPATPRPTPRPVMDRDEIQRRRSQQIEEHITAARVALDASNPDETIARCEQALLLDPNDLRAVDIAERARRQRDETIARQCLTEAQEQLRKGDLTAASGAVRHALALVPESSDALELSRLIGETRLQREQERRRTETVQQALTHARAALDADDPAAALAACDEALAIHPAHEEALQLRTRAGQAAEAHERRTRERARTDAAQRTADEARRLFETGQHEEALALLEEAVPQHPIVSQLWTELSAARSRIAAAPLAPALDIQPTVLVPRREPPSHDTGSRPRTDTASLRADRVPPQADPASSRADRVAPRAESVPREPRRPVIGYAAAAVLLLVAAAAGAYFVFAPDGPSEVIADSGPDPDTTPGTLPVGSTLRVSVDAAARIAVNGEPRGTATAGQVLLVPVDLGEWVVQASSTELSTVQVEQRVDVAEANREIVVVLPLLAAIDLAREREALAQASRDAAAREETAAREAAAREQAAAQTLREQQAARDRAAQEARDQAAAQSLREQQAARDRAAQEARDQAAAQALRDQQAERERAAQAARDRTAQDQAAAQAQAAQEQAAARKANESQILAVLTAYSQAHRDRSVQNVQRVYPDVDASTLDDSFRNAREITVDIENPRITIEGERAVVDAAYRLTYVQAAGGRTQRDEAPRRFSLERRAGRWVIVSIERRG